MELEVIKLLSTKDSYYKYESIVVRDRLSEDVLLILDNLQLYYDEVGVSDVDWNNFYYWYTSLKHPALPAPKAAILRGMCDKLITMRRPSTVVLKNFLIRDYAAQLGDISFDLIDGGGKHSISDADELIIECKRELKKLDGKAADTHISSTDLLDRLESLNSGTGYEWRLNELQVSIGSIRKGDFLIVGARPDSGKTTFLADQATFFARQLNDGECVLWFNNEEDVARVRHRQTQAALNWTDAEINKDKKAAVEQFAKAIGGSLERLVVYDKADLSVTDIDRACARFNPSIIIIDQLWKLTGFERETNNQTERYARVANYIRELAKTVGPVIGTSQIDAQAEGEQYPDMGRLYNSKTAVQGEADVIIMIGRDHDEGPSVRHVHAPKNKLSGGNNKFRNARWAVGIDQERARFKSKITYRS